jgi:excisionase family DNA binding protein
MPNADNPALLIMITNTQNDTLLDTAAVAKLASVSPRTIANWLESRSISCIRMGRVVRFCRATFMAELRAFSTTTVGRR